MKERAQELKAEARRDTRANKRRAGGESDVLSKIAAMQDRSGPVKKAVS